MNISLSPKYNRIFKTFAAVLAVIIATATIAAVSTSCKPIEDLNGPGDKTLATLTETDLMKISGSISSGSSRKSGRQSIQREDDDYSADYDFDNIELEFSKLNGTQKAMVTYLEKGESLTIEFSSSITAGNFTAVLLSPEKNILGRAEADKAVTLKITTRSEGDHILVVAGESAAGSIKISRSYN